MTAHARHLLAVGCVSLSVLPFTACGDDSAKSGDPSSTQAGQAPEDRFAPDSQVAAGLRALDGIAASIGRLPDSDASKAASERLEPVWKKVEGTVRRNAPDLYITIEEDLSLLSSGVAEKTRTGAAEMHRIVTQYLDKYPG